MPFDLTILEQAVTFLRRVTPSPPGSVTDGGIVMHEILGGQTDKPALFGKGYLLAWAKGGNSAIVPASKPPKAAPGEQVTGFPTITVTSPAGPIAGFPLRFTVVDGSGFLEEGQTVVQTITDATGKGTVSSWTMGPVAGANTVLVEGFGVSQRFTIDAA